MTKEELLQVLEDLAHEGDLAAAHAAADDALLDYIDDADVTRAYGEIEKDAPG